MPEPFVQVTATNGTATYHFLIQTKTIALAALTLSRQTPDLDIVEATVVNYDGLILAGPIQPDDKETANDSTTEDPNKQEASGETTGDSKSGPRPTDQEPGVYFDEDFYEG